jgi:hypothetical protein
MIVRILGIEVVLEPPVSWDCRCALTIGNYQLRLFTVPRRPFLWQDMTGFAW